MNTTTPQLRCVEQVDDLPVLFAILDRLQIAQRFDQRWPTHPLWQGDLSKGQVLLTWIASILSQADHRLNHVQPWAQQRQHTLAALLQQTVRPLDFHDDRLADLLDDLADDDRWLDFQADLNQHILRVYDLPSDVVRIDTTTASTSADAAVLDPSACR